jgi:hypothetical protein
MIKQTDEKQAQLKFKTASQEFSVLLQYHIGKLHSSPRAMIAVSWSSSMYWFTKPIIHQSSNDRAPMTAPVVLNVDETSGRVCHSKSITVPGYNQGFTACLKVSKPGARMASQSTCPSPNSVGKACLWIPRNYSI